MNKMSVFACELCNKIFSGIKGKRNCEESHKKHKVQSAANVTKFVRIKAFLKLT